MKPWDENEVNCHSDGKIPLPWKRTLWSLWQHVTLETNTAVSITNCYRGDQHCGVYDNTLPWKSTLQCRWRYLGDEDGCVHDGLDVPQPPTRLQPPEELTHGRVLQLSHCKNTPFPTSFIFHHHPIFSQTITIRGPIENCLLLLFITSSSVVLV